MSKKKGEFLFRFSFWWRIRWSNELKFVCFQIKWNRKDDLFFCFRIWTDETKRKINEIVEIKRHHLPQFESNIFCRYRFLSTVNGVRLPIGNLTDYTAESIYESCLNSSSSWFVSHVIYVLIVSSTVSSLIGCLTTSFSLVVDIHSFYRHRHFNETNDELMNINPDCETIIDPHSSLVCFHFYLMKFLYLGDYQSFLKQSNRILFFVKFCQLFIYRYANIYRKSKIKTLFVCIFQRFCIALRHSQLSPFPFLTFAFKFFEFIQDFRLVFE